MSLTFSPKSINTDPIFVTLSHKSERFFLHQDGDCIPSIRKIIISNEHIMKYFILSSATWIHEFKFMVEKLKILE
jgi:hypothetical protein